MDYSELIDAAIEVRQQSYSPYSEFKVGAALLCKDGTVYTGCNVENASYGLAICAERNAICQAVADGQREFEAIAIAASPLASPCGACRQFIVEFGKHIRVVSVDADERTTLQEWTGESLLPDSFEF